MRNRTTSLITDPKFLEVVIAAQNHDPVPFIRYLGLESLTEDIIDASDVEDNPVKAADRISKLRSLAFDGILEALREVLTPMSLKATLDTDLPEFELDGQISGCNSSGKWPKVNPEFFEEMDDCTFETIESVLGYMFSEEIPETRLDLAFRRQVIRSELRPEYEEDVQFVARSFMLPLLRKCAAAGISLLPPELRMQGELEVTVGKREDLSEGRNGEGKRIPDWAAYLLIKGQKTYVLLAETKLSSKWSSSRLPKTFVKTENDDFDLSDDYLRPLCQIAGQCSHGGTQWAFAFTPLEVVLFRFFKAPASDPKSNEPEFGFRYKAIPLLNQDGKEQLNAMLGTWSWVMFSCIERHRPIVEYHQLCPLKDMLTMVADEPSVPEVVMTDTESCSDLPVSPAYQLSLDLAKKSSDRRHVRKRGANATPHPVSQAPQGIWTNRLRPRNRAGVVGLRII